MSSTEHGSGIPVPETDQARADERPLQLRQGDVLLTAVPAIPADAVRQPRHGRLILAEGEATGHAHAIAERDAREFRVGDERFVLVRSAAQLIHEEHATIDLAPGYHLCYQSGAGGGFELTRPCGPRCLRPLRLPFRHPGALTA